jgi:hypothetical protein
VVGVSRNMKSKSGVVTGAPRMAAAALPISTVSSFFGGERCRESLEKRAAVHEERRTIRGPVAICLAAVHGPHSFAGKCRTHGGRVSLGFLWASLFQGKPAGSQPAFPASPRDDPLHHVTVHVRCTHDHGIVPCRAWRASARRIATGLPGLTPR